jgi:HlyD family secretion protein
MKKKTWLMAIGGTVVLVMGLVWAFAPRPVAVELAPVVVGHFETTIDEDGKTRLTDRYVVSAPLAGRLARITLKEGDAVTVDMPLAQLTSVLPTMLDERTLRELRARVEGAQDNVSRAGSRIARAQVSLDQAKNEVRRSEQLAQQGFIAPVKVEAERLNTVGAQRELEAAAAERRMAVHELEQTQAAISAVQPPAVSAGTSAGSKADTNAVSSKGSFTVRAPSTGRVLRVLQTSEGAAALGTPLLEIGDTHRMEIIAELLTTDALVARPGSRVMIERWGGPTTLDGRVRSVEPAAFTKVSALGVEEQRVRVVIEITSPQAQWQALGDGYRVSVRIVTMAEDKAVQVPVSAVFPLPAEDAESAIGRPTVSRRFAVFVADGGRARQVPVELGARNGSAALIRSGIAPGQHVIVYPPATVKDGQRVAVRKP